MNLGTATVLLIVVAICALAAKSVFGKRGSCHCDSAQPAAGGVAKASTVDGCSPAACAGCASAGCCGAAKIYGINDFGDSRSSGDCPHCE